MVARHADIEPCDDPRGHKWAVTDDLDCEVCGNHIGWICEYCWQTVDSVWYFPPEGAPEIRLT